MRQYNLYSRPQVSFPSQLKLETSKLKLADEPTCDSGDSVGRIGIGRRASSYLAHTASIVSTIASPSSGSYELHVNKVVG